ncbi:hypothetical protein [Winogradskyella sp. PE311]|uniref:hypothetical protein n=1 Tax=Winogradskyella sp. PE311 TaxID=3366943 RepID=UPI00397FCDE5
MKKYYLIIIVLLFSVGLLAQENEKLDLLKADSTWLKEIIKFPFGFAPQIEFEGYEDLRFAKDWSKPKGSEFFTYAFVWNINLYYSPSTDLIEKNIKLYYDGLMTAVNKEKHFTVPKTNVNFHQLNNKNGLPLFTGTIQLNDSFFTKKIIQLNVTVETLYCKINKRYLLYFKVSTHKIGSDTWKKFDELELKNNYCEL